MTPLFGPGGNSKAFADSGLTSSVYAPEWLMGKGLDAYEYEAGNGLSASDDTLLRIGREAIRCGIKMSYHAPYFISLSGINPKKRLNSIEYIRQSINAAHLLGADIIVVHCGSCAKISRDKAMLLSEDTLYKILESVDTKGVRIGLETMGKINQLGTVDEVIRLCKMDSSLVPVVDFGHLNARHLGGLFKSAEDYIRIFDKIADALGDNVARNLHCHFSKIEWGQSGEKKHLTFEDSIYGPDPELFVKVLHTEGLTPTVICESAGTQSEDACFMKACYNKYSKGDEI